MRRIQNNKPRSERKVLASNTIMLFVLTISNYVFGFLTVPYQTRILGPDLYGVIGFAMATTGYFQVVLDFGFTLSGTANVARAKDDKKRVSALVESVLAGKVLLFLMCLIALLVMCRYISRVSDHSLVFLLFLLYAFANSLIPDFLYRGMENMKPITYRTVFIKFLFTIMIFVFVKSQKDYVLVPLLYLIGSLLATIIAFIDIKKRFDLSFVKISVQSIIDELKQSAPFFVSRVATTVYGATNTFLLGLKYAGLPDLGYYAAADKVVTIARSGASPISDSLYPYLIRNRDFKLVKKVLFVLMPIIICAGIGLFITAPLFCRILFGAGYESAAPALRCLIPVMIMVLPEYILGFPMMTPLGIANKANLSVVIGALVQIVLLLALWVTGYFGVVGVCVCTSITELVVLIYRSITVYTTMKQLKTVGL